jgi:uncharacterized membrane protein YphA (DoxX/SURF4 family)
MAQAFLVGRILVGGYYLASAFHHFSDTAALMKYAAMHGVPAPQVAVIVGGILLAVAGISLILGLYPTVGVGALVLFLIPVTLLMHPFWADRDPGMQQMDMVNFTKNIGLLGSSLMFLAIPRPWPYSVERRVRIPVRATV